MTMLGQDELVQEMGVGYLGEVRQGPDGQVYQWVHGVDGLGNPVGFWKALKRVGQAARRVAQRAMPLVRQIAPLVPGGAAALRVATPLLQRAGVAGGIGALYQADDGAVYAAELDTALQGFAHDGVGAAMGVGYLGEVRQAGDGQLYQWVEGIDGLGNPVGFWKRLRRVGPAVRAAAQRALPLIQQAATLVPGGTAALQRAAPVLQRAGGAETDAGVGALFQVDDGTVYQGSAPEFAAPDDAGAEYGADTAPGAQLDGFAQADLPLPSDGGAEELTGIDGYLWDDPALRGIGAYVAPQPPTTPAFVRPAQAPEIWKPLW